MEFERVHYRTSMLILRDLHFCWVKDYIKSQSAHFLLPLSLYGEGELPCSLRPKLEMDQSPRVK